MYEEIHTRFKEAIEGYRRCESHRKYLQQASLGNIAKLQGNID